MSAPGTDIYGFETQRFVEILGDIVALVSTNLTPKLSEYDNTITGVNYLYGPPKEIIKTLQEWNGTSKANAKYPIVALFQPFEETKGDRADLDGVDKVRIIIGRQSQPDWLTNKRYEVNFVPVLYPIYTELIKQLCLNTTTVTQINKIHHVKIDWPYWDDGKDSNPFNDWLDVIEIKDLKLNIRKAKTC